MTHQIKCGGCRGMFDPEELKPCLYCDTMLCEDCHPECDCVNDFQDFSDDEYRDYDFEND